jgi:release factor glutamine methyltransferase
MRAAPTVALAWHRTEARESPRTNSERLVIDPDELTQRLSQAGFIAADEEARELIEASNGDDAVLESLVERRLRGEPLAWIVGFATFCGLRVNVDVGVFVPRWQSEPLARLAAKRLPTRGVAIDVCTGSGAIATWLRARRPLARIVATDLDERAVACAASNGVEVYLGDLFQPLAPDLEGHADVVVSVVPYVPTPSLSLLPRDTFAFETTLSYDGGEDGAEVLRRVVCDSARFLRTGGALLLELGGDQAEVVHDDLVTHGYTDVVVHRDDDGDVRAIVATLRR